MSAILDTSDTGSLLQEEKVGGAHSMSQPEPLVWITLSNQQVFSLRLKRVTTPQFRQHEHASGEVPEQDQPGFAAPHRYLATIWLAAGDDAAYLRELRLSALARHDDGDMALAAAGTAGLARGGHLGMLRALLADQQALYAAGRQSAFRLAAAFAALHDMDDALTYIGASISRHEPDSIALKVDPPFDSLRSDPRFVSLVARAGLDAGS